MNASYKEFIKTKIKSLGGKEIIRYKLKNSLNDIRKGSLSCRSAISLFSTLDLSDVNNNEKIFIAETFTSSLELITIFKALVPIINPSVPPMEDLIISNSMLNTYDKKSTSIIELICEIIAYDSNITYEMLNKLRTVFMNIKIDGVDPCLISIVAERFDNDYRDYIEDVCSESANLLVEKYLVDATEDDVNDLKFAVSERMIKASFSIVEALFDENTTDEDIKIFFDCPHTAMYSDEFWKQKSHNFVDEIALISSPVVDANPQDEFSWLFSLEYTWELSGLVDHIIQNIIECTLRDEVEHMLHTFSNNMLVKGVTSMDYLRLINKLDEMVSEPNYAKIISVLKFGVDDNGEDN